MTRPNPITAKKAPRDPALWEMIDKYDDLNLEINALNAAIVRRALEEYGNVPGLVNINWDKLRKLVR